MCQIAFMIPLTKSNLGQGTISLGLSVWIEPNSGLKTLNIVAYLTHNYEKGVLEKLV